MLKREGVALYKVAGIPFIRKLFLYGFNCFFSQGIIPDRYGYPYRVEQ